jgi:hypothetical protein
LKFCRYAVFAVIYKVSGLWFYHRISSLVTVAAANTAAALAVVTELRNILDIIDVHVVRGGNEARVLQSFHLRLSWLDELVGCQVEVPPSCFT